jgi:hypothetical protein
MCVVETFYAYSQCSNTKERQKDFYFFVAKELIDNRYNSIGPGSTRQNRMENAQEARARMMTNNNGLPTCGYGPHITPTKRRRIRKGVIRKSLHQGKCRFCKRKTTFLCSVWKEENSEGNDGQHGKEAWICMNKQGQTCLANHVTDQH